MNFMKNTVKLIRFMFDKEVSITKKLLFIFPFIYFISPITIIPYYFFPLAGWLDNVLVLVGMSFVLRRILDNYEPGKSSGRKQKKDSDEDDVIDIGRDDYQVK